jgi:hypothetical protein
MTYFSPCVVTGADGKPLYSTDVAVIDLATPCNHYKTRNSPLGSVWTISTSLPLSNTPLSGAKFNGLFLKKQFWDIFADPEPTDYLFMPSWNEFAVGNTNMSGWDMKNPYFYSLGAHPDDPDRYNLFLDGMGSERSRTIEPSVQDGGYYYNLLASCMRVYRLQAALGIIGDGLGCAIQGEECCTINDNQRFTLVWSMDSPGRNTSTTPDTLLSSVSSEVQTLAAAGWDQVCAPWSMASGANGGPTGVCANNSLPWTAPNADVPVPFDPAYSAVRGPFILYMNTTQVPLTVPFVRCVDSTGPYPCHYLANSTACTSAHGAGVAEYVLGYGGASRDSLFLRDVHRCWTTYTGADLPGYPSNGGAAARAAQGSGSWYHTANGPCAPGDVDEGVVGYAM